MGTFSIWHWIVVLVVVLLLFGKGKIPALMGDVAKGVKAFKSGLKDDDETASDSKAIDEDKGGDTAMAKEKDEASSRA